MKKIVISILICTLLVFGGATALAEGADTPTSGIQYEVKTRTIEDLFDTYNPTEKLTFLNLQEQHQTFHEERRSARTEVQQNFAEQLSTISGNVADGTITPAEGLEQLQTLRSRITELREEIQAVLSQKQIEADAIKSKTTALRELIKNALQQDEVVASDIASYLEGFNDLFAGHLTMDYKYADMVDSLLSAY